MAGPNVVYPNKSDEDKLLEGIAQKPTRGTGPKRNKKVANNTLEFFRSKYWKKYLQRYQNKHIDTRLAFIKMAETDTLKSICPDAKEIIDLAYNNAKQVNKNVTPEAMYKSITETLNKYAEKTGDALSVISEDTYKEPEVPNEEIQKFNKLLADEVEKYNNSNDKNSYTAIYQAILAASRNKQDFPYLSKQFADSIRVFERKPINRSLNPSKDFVKSILPQNQFEALDNMIEESKDNKENLSNVINQTMTSDNTLIKTIETKNKKDIPTTENLNGLPSKLDTSEDALNTVYKKRSFNEITRDEQGRFTKQKKEDSNRQLDNDYDFSGNIDNIMGDGKEFRSIWDDDSYGVGEPRSGAEALRSSYSEYKKAQSERDIARQKYEALSTQMYGAVVDLDKTDKYTPNPNVAGKQDELANLYNQYINASKRLDVAKDSIDEAISRSNFRKNADVRQEFDNIMNELNNMSKDVSLSGEDLSNVEMLKSSMSAGRSESEAQHRIDDYNKSNIITIKLVGMEGPNRGHKQTLYYESTPEKGFSEILKTVLRPNSMFKRVRDKAAVNQDVDEVDESERQQDKSIIQTPVNALRKGNVLATKHGRVILQNVSKSRSEVVLEGVYADKDSDRYQKHYRMIYRPDANGRWSDRSIYTDI